MLVRTFTLLLFFLKFSMYAFTQSHSYNFSHIDIKRGLSHNQINTIFKDKDGFLWFGTLAGLNRFDGYDFKIFKHSATDTTSIADDFIIRVTDGPDGNLWVFTRKGVNIYQPSAEKFTRNLAKVFKDLNLPQNDELIDMKGGSDGSYWFLFKYHGLYHYTANKKVHHFQNPENTMAVAVSPLQKGGAWLLNDDGSISLLQGNKIILRKKVFEQFFNSSYESCVSFADRDGDLYVFSTINYKGVYHYSLKKQKTEHLHTDCKDLRLNTNLVKGIGQDENGMIWIATDHGGINLYDKHKGNIQYLVHKEYDERSIRQNSINSIYIDDNDIVWLGSFKKGISYYHPNIIKFPHQRHQPSNPHSLPFDDVNTFAEDAKGNLWIGTNGGGLIYYNRANNTYKTYKYQADKNSLSNNVVVSLLIDKKQKLWIGTYYGGLDCFDGQKFINYKKSSLNSNSLSDDRVFSLQEDKDGEIWIGTLGGGLNRLDPQTGNFMHFRSGDKVISDDYVSSILERGSGDIWIGTSLGLDILRKQNNGKAYKNFFSVSADENNGLSNANINCMAEDAKGFVWIGTRNGLNVHNPKGNNFIKLDVANGLPDNNIQAIKADLQGNIWAATSKGLSKVMIEGNHPENYQFKFFNFDELDGLQGLEFNLNSAGITKKGELLFGGPNGFNLFQPQKIIAAGPQFQIRFTDLNILNKTVAVGEAVNGDIVLEESIGHLKSFTLNHLANAFSISFAALNYFSPEKVRYFYKLEGFDKDWVPADPKVRKATYTNLDAGNYDFKVRAIAGEELRESSLSITVLPPFWKTPLAYLLYVAAILATLFVIRKRGINKLKNQLKLEQERKETQRIHEMDLMKIRFLTNASHEFRTPLSLILAPIDKFLKNTKSEEEKHQYELIRRNAKRLLNLVNQLMDFRKMEVKELSLNRKKGDVILFIKDLVDSFTDLAEKKNIRLIFESEIENLITYYDADKLERILFNLLSNAFKFTYEDGLVSVLLNKVTEKGKDFLELKVIDTGIGIPKEQQAHIFDNFYQHEMPSEIMNQGSGIGLSITKEFVKLHGGDIQVESELNIGTCFTVLLPVEILSIENRKISESYQIDEPVFKAETYENSKKPLVLIVEDNTDFRFYLKENLSQHFRIIEASNGLDGWHKVLGAQPKLLISDISMPKINGIELCNKIKHDARTKHIPLILLTALTGEEQLIRGLETGASDYLTKPFNFEILLSKMKNLLAQQDLMIKTYKNQVEAIPSKVEVQSINEKLIQQALLIVENNIANSGFSVEELAREMNMSRVALYKKILSLTGQSPVAFIRSIRLKRSKQLLEHTGLSIAEIAYEVGFSNPKYFTKSFKQEFGYLPSEWLNKFKSEGV